MDSFQDSFTSFVHFVLWTPAVQVLIQVLEVLGETQDSFLSSFWWLHQYQYHYLGVQFQLSLYPLTHAHTHTHTRSDSGCIPTYGSFYHGCKLYSHTLQ